MTKVICIAAISPVLIVAVGYLALMLFWWAGDEEISTAGRNGETLAIHLRTKSVRTIRVSEIAAGAGLSVRTCMCVSTPYADPGPSLVVGDNDITEKFGSELSNDGVVGVMTFEPELHGDMERALVSRQHIDFSVPFSDADQKQSGIWCGSSEAMGDVSDSGERIIVVFRDSAQPDAICKIKADPK